MEFPSKEIEVQSYFFYMCDINSTKIFRSMCSAEPRWGWGKTISFQARFEKTLILRSVHVWTLRLNDRLSKCFKSCALGTTLLHPSPGPGGQIGQIWQQQVLKASATVSWRKSKSSPLYFSHCIQWGGEKRLNFALKIIITLSF